MFNLSIKRTAVSKRRCNYPSCWHTNGLTNISREMRYRIAVQRKVYIPKYAVACSIHNNLAAWENSNETIEANDHQFRREYIEDMFDLLTNPTTKIVGCLESRMYYFVQIHSYGMMRYYSYDYSYVYRII